jgi:hypothetical protein
MTSDTLKTAIVSLGAPLIILILTVSFVVLNGDFEADPDYAYLLNGLNILHFQSPGHADHPGTPVQLLGGIVIGVIWLARWVTFGQVALDDDVLRHPELYLTGINAVLMLLTTVAMGFFGRQVRRWTGSFAAAIVGQVTLLVSVPVLISLPHVTPEPLLISLTIFLAGLLAPAISQPTFPWRRVGYPLLIGGTLGACIATKMTAAPLIVTVALLRGVKMQAIALAAAVVGSIVLTLPVARLYGSILSWTVALVIHSGTYGGGPAGLPALSVLFENMKLMFESFPEPFVGVAICAVMALWHQNAAKPNRHRHVRFFAVCAILISVQLITVAKHYSLRYAVPIAAIVALANAGAVCMAAAWPGPRRIGFAVVISVLLCLEIWHAASAASDWYGTSNAMFKEKQSLIAKAASTGCLLVPHYGASTQQFNLYFGDRLARGLYTRRLAALYPEFVTFNGKQFEAFGEMLDPAQAEQRLSGQCVYLVGSPVERFIGFAIPSSELTLVARSQGGLGDALVIYQVSPKVFGQLRSETPR